MNIKETKDGAVLEVFVKPNSQRFDITVDDPEIEVFPFSILYSVGQNTKKQRETEKVADASITGFFCAGL